MQFLAPHTIIFPLCWFSSRACIQLEWSQGAEKPRSSWRLDLGIHALPFFVFIIFSYSERISQCFDLRFCNVSICPLPICLWFFSSRVCFLYVWSCWVFIHQLINPMVFDTGVFQICSEDLLNGTLNWGNCDGFFYWFQQFDLIIINMQ